MAGMGGSEGLRGAQGPGRSPRVSVNGDQSSWRPPAYLRRDIINLGRKASGLLSGRTAPLMRLINYSRQRVPSAVRLGGELGTSRFWGGRVRRQGCETAPCTHRLWGRRVPELPEPSSCLVPQFPHLVLRDQAAAACVGVSGCSSSSGRRSDKGQVR